jgi:hypothetical protein
MANAVALWCNWKGKRGKYGLHSTIMKQIICGELLYLYERYRVLYDIILCAYVLSHLSVVQIARGDGCGFDMVKNLISGHLCWV